MCRPARVDPPTGRRGTPAANRSTRRCGHRDPGPARADGPDRPRGGRGQRLVPAPGHHLWDRSRARPRSDDVRRGDVHGDVRHDVRRRRARARDRRARAGGPPAPVRTVAERARRRPVPHRCGPVRDVLRAALRRGVRTDRPGTHVVDASARRPRTTARCRLGPRDLPPRCHVHRRRRQPLARVRARRRHLRRVGDRWSAPVRRCGGPRRRRGDVAVVVADDGCRAARRRGSARLHRPDRQGRPRCSRLRRGRRGDVRHGAATRLQHGVVHPPRGVRAHPCGDRRGRLGRHGRPLGRGTVLAYAAAVVLFALGNLAAFSLGALVGAIQALRLEYYELFSRLFTDQGRPFRPWHVPTTRLETS